MASTTRNPSKYGTLPLHMEWMITPLEGLTPLTWGGSIRPPKWSRLIWPVWESELNRILCLLALSLQHTSGRIKELLGYMAFPSASPSLPACLASITRTGQVIRWGPETLGILAVSTASVPAVYLLEAHV